MKVVLDLHDWTPSFHRMELLHALKEYFPKFKVSLFAIPIEKRMDYGPYLFRQEIVRAVKHHLDWMQFIPHGLTHESNTEMLKYGYDNFRGYVMPAIKKAFEEDDLPFERGFCAPHWRWSEGVVEALDEAGWWGAVLREEKGPITKKFYRYNFLLNEPFWESDLPVLKIHGHIYGTKNDIGLCFENLLKLPKDTEFHYVTDFLEDRK